MDVIAAYPIKVKTKLFCGCAHNGSCPICDGIPAMLPLLNREALRKTVIAARLLGCDMNLSLFYRVPALHCGQVHPVLSARPAPLGINGSFKSAENISVYPQESFTVVPHLSYGLPMLCVRASVYEPDITALLMQHDIVSGRPSLSLRDDGADITVIVPDAQSLSEAGSVKVKRPGIYTAEHYYDTSAMPAEPEPDMCMLHIDPFTADALVRGEITEL